MLPNDLLKYLGHSSVEPEFDDYLSSIGFEGRPKKNEITVYVDSKDKSLVLTFQAYEAYVKENLVAPKSEGKFIFQTATFHSHFQFDLPFGLKFSSSQSDVVAALGAPRKWRELPNKESSGTYFYKGILIVVRFKDGGNSINWMSASNPDIYDRKSGLVD